MKKDAIRERTDIQRELYRARDSEAALLDACKKAQACLSRIGTLDDDDGEAKTQLSQARAAVSAAIAKAQP